ncbi:MAG TPA: penicillin acylase family protein [Longimicrobiales bacterium]|nr:penicillin acylase family protein [Longimicrobiales bacterium]
MPPIPVDSAAEAAVAARVEIIRTEYGIPHIYAQDLQAMGFGLAWVELEDYGEVIALNMVRARGEYGLYTGRDSIGGDFGAREDYAYAVTTWPLLRAETRAVYEGFAAGVRHYVRLHRTEFPAWIEPVWTGLDAHAREVEGFGGGSAAGFIRTLQRARGAAPPPDEQEEMEMLDGSNAWAFDGTRTTSGKAILLRNPHLSWTAGYYEAHVVVPGLVDFYGDFRIGSAFGTVGGFNRHLGFATTNNAPVMSQIYAFEADPNHENHYILDGRSHALQERKTTVEYRTPEGGIGTETRSSWSTDFGPVIHQGDGRVYISKNSSAGEFRRGEQFLRMMTSTSLEEWLEVMKLRAHPSSNFTYADAAGNIVHYYNGRMPRLPHPVTPDSFYFARTSAEIWKEVYPFEDHPLYINPKGGYTTQTNDSPDYTNLNVPMSRDTVPPNVEPVRLRPRSQMSLTLVHGDAMLSLEDVVELKHSPRMLVAERVMDELLAAIRKSGTANDGKLAQALRALERWDRTAAAESRGGVLFYAWESQYRQVIDTSRFFREPWTPERPMETPMGIGSPNEAASAFADAVAWMDERGWAYDMKWGDAFRVIRGKVDEPVSGCPGTLGCFRTLSFGRDPSGRFAANTGDAWVLAVEFGDIPRAYTVLAYGQSNQEGHPYYDDQASIFARGQMKTVRFTREDVDRAAQRRYRPDASALR